MSNKIVAIHQPDFFPWLGVFNKILRSDIFVVYDSCRKDSKLGWTKRVKIIKGNGTQWLGLSIQKVSKNENGLYPMLYKHRIRNLNENKKNHFRILRAQYQKSPYFNEIFPFIIELYNYETEKITEFNRYTIKEICEKLFINTPQIKSSKMKIETASTEANIEITKKAGGEIYLSGDGSQGYLDEKLFEKQGIFLHFTNFKHPVYPQFNTGGFIPGLSVIDSLMNVGFEGVRKLLTINNAKG